MASKISEGEVRHKEESQVHAVRAFEMLQFANVTCDPPLGQTTCVPFGQTSVTFTVLIESTSVFPDQPWEAIVWHNGHDGRQWRELAMREVAGGTSPLAINSQKRAKAHRRYFSIDLPRPSSTEHPVQFTLKYRTVASDRWKWANENLTLRDGEICFQPGTFSNSLSDYFKDFSSDLNIQLESSEAPGAKLWSVSGAVEAAEGENSGITKISLGKPRDYTRWFSLIRPWTPWLAPKQGKAPFDCDNACMLCAFQRWDGLVVVMLAVSGISDVLTEMKSGNDGDVVAELRNDLERVNKGTVLVAVAPTFEIANSACIYQARNIVRGYQDGTAKRDNEIQELMSKIKIEESIDDWHDGLTYCTWNSLGQQLSQDKIYDALEDLKKNKVNITNLIIDDGWQTLDNLDGPDQWTKGWSEFEANKNFPDGMKNVIGKIRGDHPNIRHVAVWHALLGYWGGIDPNGKLAKEYKTKKVATGGGAHMTVIDADDMTRLYVDFYKFLLSSGIDGVKTDGQYFLDVMDAAPDRRRFMNRVQDIWNLETLRYFGTDAISCMSMFPQNLYHSLLPTNKPSFMLRNSDDFFPDIPSSHPWHIFVNAHNALFNCHTSSLPDWDMFQTKHEYSSFHAAGRCLSGGPIYITDTPGEHDLDLIAQMTATTIQGQTIVLRPSTWGKTTGVFRSYEEERFLKVGSFHGGKGGTTLLGIFNVNDRTLTELINIKDFPGVESEDEYVIRAHTTGETSSPMVVGSQLSVLSVELPVRKAEILSAYPLRAFTLGDSTGLKSSATKVAVLGLLGKMTGAAAVLESDLRMQGGRLRIQTSLKALGVLGIYVSTAPSLKVSDDVIIMIREKVIPVDTVTLNTEHSVLEVDVEAAWKKMDLEPAYSNTVEVEIWIR